MPGSKRVHSLTSPMFLPVKRRKRTVDLISSNAGLWMFDEGLNCLKGCSFKKIDSDRGRMLVEAAVACGCELARAFCLAKSCYFNCWEKDKSSWYDIEWDNAMEAFLILDSFTADALEHQLPAHIQTTWMYMQGMLFEQSLGSLADDENDFEDCKLFCQELKQRKFEDCALLHQNKISEAASMGNVHAMIQMSKILGRQRSLHAFWGLDDFTMEFAWMERAAKLGSAEAMFETAVMLRIGKGVEKQLSKARQWLLQAIDQSHAEAKNMLGTIDAEMAAKERAAQAVADLAAARALQARMRDADY